MSDLQKTILMLGREKAGGALPYAEILCHYYDWAAEREISPGTQNFSKARIGEREYRRARAALSRSVRCLAERGLVNYANNGFDGKPIRYAVGVFLTDQGREEAQKLAVNPVQYSAERQPLENRRAAVKSCP